MKILIGLVSIAALALTASGQPRAVTVGDAAQVSFHQTLGSRIAFTRIRENVLDPDSNFRFDAEIWMMNGDGSDPIRLTRNFRDDLGAEWSPDGRTIAFHGAQWTVDEVTGEFRQDRPQIFLVDVESGVEMPLLTDEGVPVLGRYPSWSPDGLKIAYDSGRQSSQIFSINLDGTGQKQLTHPEQLIEGLFAPNIRPDWSPDGRKIAFSSGPNRLQQIYVMNADGSDLVRLTDNAQPECDPTQPCNAVAPDWSPNGQRIAFHSNRVTEVNEESNSNIYVMNADGTDPQRLTGYPGPDLDADWSPDGRMIVFQRQIQSDTRPRDVNQLFVVSADGGEAVPLTALCGPVIPCSANGHPAWSRGRAVKP
jgi:Tol biopolymer transport system component